MNFIKDAMKSYLSGWFRLVIVCLAVILLLSALSSIWRFLVVMAFLAFIYYFIIRKQR